MQFVFKNASDAEVRVQIADKVDADARIRMFGLEDKSSTLRQMQGTLYARATYLKYHSAIKEFSSVAGGLEEWSKRRNIPESNRVETLLLLEAFVSGDDRVAGALLLRSAWNNDIIIDFLVVNQEVTLSHAPPIEGLGVLLCYSAFSIGQVSDAERVHVETARHTKHYWPRVCAGGTELIRTEQTEVAAKAAARILGVANWAVRVEK